MSPFEISRCIPDDDRCLIPTYFPQYEHKEGEERAKSDGEGEIASDFRRLIGTLLNEASKQPYCCKSISIPSASSSLNQIELLQFLLGSLLAIGFLVVMDRDDLGMMMAGDGRKVRSFDLGIDMLKNK
ncbi:NADH-ubiquinone oxidoreductase chain 1 [Striga asiatica]|uniref:NADH-ubiquinone oxidoreductase chain 1 n=1 Tax=Striga asiatica TaxID=4170 RepID=A0A5A7PPL6_STRAF|nr:NADH-ubiquinone oxidoreductase chain 1 [Striga asiatica]